MTESKRKPCKDCGSYTRKVTPPGPRCATCHREEKKRLSKAAHTRRTKSRYGLKPGQYDEILDAQGGVCYLCRRANGATKRLAIDHDHKCCPGKKSCGACVRGLLCGPCNDVLAIARDDPAYFWRAVAYLSSPPAKAVLNAPVPDLPAQRSGADEGEPVVQAQPAAVESEVRRKRDTDPIPGVDDYAERLRDAALADIHRKPPRLTERYTGPWGGIHDG